MDQSSDHKKRIENISNSMPKIKHKIAIMSGKGGVGKTTIAVNLARSLSDEHDVGLLDTDITGPNVPKMLGLEEKRLEGSTEGVIPHEKYGIKVMSTAFLLEDSDTPVIWRGPLRSSLITQFLSDVKWGELDYLIIDLPPGTGDEALSIAQLIPEVDGVIIVTTPQDVALLDCRKAINFSKKLNIPIIGLIENMAGFTCPHCKKQTDLFGVGGGEKASSELGLQFLGRIPLDPEIVTTGDGGTPFVSEKKHMKAAKALQEIAIKVKTSMGDKK